ncbi:hypothetical protein AGMMS50230_11110 [Spirochaetia bacterium]|nr:hypothetical protein AGMMS50230_11110 [Spirochaetia bacterium]
MKRTIVVFVLILSAAAVFAQTAPAATPAGSGMDAAAAAPAAPAAVTVSGQLALVKGRIALQSGSDVYYVAGIQRLIGFVDGLKEGARISLEGYVRNFPQGNEKMLWASKLTIAGKSYDLAPAAGQRNFMGSPLGDTRGSNFSGNRGPGWNRQSSGRDSHCAPGGRGQTERRR